jgi:hypothetical protein
VRYAGLYDGIDVRVGGEADGELEYELLVAPGADVAEAVFHAEGGVAKVAADGSLTIQAPGGTLHQTAPVSWDVLPGGAHRPLESHFRVTGEGTSGFEVVGHDPSLPLVIDPILGGPPPAPTIVGSANGASVTFTVSTNAVTAATSVLVSVTGGGVTRSATLTVTPAQADTVGVTRAEYTVSKQQLRVEATSTSASATLQVFVTSTNQLIGTLTNNGGGRYTGQFTWPTNPQTVTIKSSLGGSASKAVTLR